MVSIKTATLAITALAFVNAAAIVQRDSSASVSIGGSASGASTLGDLSGGNIAGDLTGLPGLNILEALFEDGAAGLEALVESVLSGGIDAGTFESILSNGLGAASGGSGLSSLGGLGALTSAGQTIAGQIGSASSGLSSVSSPTDAFDEIERAFAAGAAFVAVGLETLGEEFAAEFLTLIGDPIATAFENALEAAIDAYNTGSFPSLAGTDVASQIASAAGQLQSALSGASTGFDTSALSGPLSNFENIYKVSA
jgi:hypothetical protein